MHVLLLQRGQPIAAVLLDIAIRADAEHPEVEQAERGGGNPFEPESLGPERAPRCRALPEQCGREALHLLELLEVAPDAPIRVVEILPASGRVGADRL